MPKLKEKSKWDWVGSSGFSGSIDIIVAVGGGKGTFTLKSPGGVVHKFNYASLGVGVGVGAKIGLGASTDAHLDTGRIWITESFGRELDAGDLTGGTLFVEASAGIGEDGVSATAMLLGIPLRNMQNEFYNEVGELLIGIGGGQMGIDFARHKGWLVTHAKAVLLMAGQTAGFNLGVGAMGNVGYMWQGAVKSIGTPVVDIKDENHGYNPIRVRVSAQESPFITISGDVLFDFNRFNIKPTAEKELAKAGAKIRLYPNRRIFLNGFTDSIGSKAYNLQLSQKRADEVKKWFVSRGYVKPANMIANGFGLDNPVASNNDPAGRAKNRRVEIFIPPT